MNPCAICTEEIGSGHAGTEFLLPCGHMFHYECVIKWEKRICPVCRKPYAIKYEMPQVDKK